MLPRNVSNDFFMEVLKGNTDEFSAVRLIGCNPDNDAATEDVWIGCSIAFGDGTPTERTLRSSASQLYVCSSANHATDRAASAVIVGLDANYNTVSETVKLNSTNSTTRVSTTNSYLRVNSVTLDRACTGNVFVFSGTATAEVPDAKAAVDAVVAAGKTYAEQALYTIPADRTGYIYAVYLETTSSANLSATLTITTDGVATSYVVGRFASPGSCEKNFIVPVEVPATSDVVLTVTSSGANVVVTAVVDMILEEKVATPTTYELTPFGVWRAYMSGKTITSANLYIIGLDEYPATLPTEVEWNVVGGPFAGQTSDNDQLNPAHTTTLTFDANYFRNIAYEYVITPGSYKALLSVWKVVDSTTATKYVLAPINTLINPTRTKTVVFSAL